MRIYVCPLLLLLAFVCFGSSFADTPSKKGVSAEAKALWDKVAKASNLSKMKDIKNLKMKMKAEVAEMGISAETETVTTKNKYYSKTNMAGQVSEQGYDGKVAWSKDLMQGIRELDGFEKEGAVQGTLGFMVDMLSYFDEVSLGKEDKFNGKDCSVLVCKKESTPEFNFYVDKSTYIVVGSSVEADMPQGKLTVKSIIEEYETTKHGFSIPKKMIIDMGMMKMQITTTEFIFDSDIDEKIFEKPEK